MNQAVRQRDETDNEDQSDLARWSSEGGSQVSYRPAATRERRPAGAPAPESRLAITVLPMPQLADNGVAAKGRQESITPMRLLCFAGFHAWSRVHGPWREIVVSPSFSTCRRCLTPIQSLWRAQYPSDGSRCGRNCKAHPGTSSGATFGS